MLDAGLLVMPALYLLTAVLVVAVIWAGDGVFVHMLTFRPLYTVVGLGVPLLAWALQNQQLLVLIHISGAFLFVGGHAVSALVAFQLPDETDGARAQALLELSSRSVLLASRRSGGPHPVRHRRGVRRPLVGSALDLAVARPAARDQRLHVRGEWIEGVQRRSDSPEGGRTAWDAEVQGMVDRRQALVFLVTGTAALVAITFLMIFKPG